MVTDGLLLVWSTTAFWIPVKPLYLRSTPSKWMEYTENCNACSLAAGIGQQKMPNSSPQYYSTTCHTTSASKLEGNGLWSFASSVIFTRPLANQPLLQASWQLFAGKMLPWSDQQEAENAFQEFVESWSTDYNFFFFLPQEYTNWFLIGKNVLVIIVPTLINKYVFELSYKDLKFRVRNRYYFCTNLIADSFSICSNSNHWSYLDFFFLFIPISDLSACLIISTFKIYLESHHVSPPPHILLWF